MKKILLFLLALVSVHVHAQITESVTFDFTRPTSLNPSISDHYTSPGDVESVYQKKFTNGPVTLSFVDYGQGVMLNCAILPDNTRLFTLSIRQRASMKVEVSGSGYALTSITFTGSIGSLIEVSSSFKRWDAYDQSTKSVEIHNGTEETFIQSITVNYTRAARQVNFRSPGFDTSEPISSFKSTELEFDQEISSISSQAPIKVYKLLRKGGSRVEGAEHDLVASKSATDPRKVVVALKDGGEIKADGYYELFVPAGAFKSVENSSTQTITIPFEIKADRAIFNYDRTVSPVPAEGTYPNFPPQITLTYEKNASLSPSASAKVYPTKDPGDFYPLVMSGDKHNIILTYDDKPLPEGDYTVEIERESITNSFNPSSGDYRYNPTIKLYYRVENEMTTLLGMATALLEQGGLEKALLGYPADDSDGRKALVAAVAKGMECPVEEMKAAIQSYRAENKVRLPESDKWYTIGAVSKNGQVLYLKYFNGELGLTAMRANASSFKALQNGTLFSIKTSDDKFLHIKPAEDGAILNLVAEGGSIYSEALERLDIDGEQLGLLTMKDAEYAVVAFGTEKLTAMSGNAIQFGTLLTSGFSFAESDAEQNMVQPTVAFQDNTVTRPDTYLLLTVTNVDKAILAENAAPYFTKNGAKVDFNDIILTKDFSHQAQFFVNTAGLQVGEYTLVMPKGTFVCWKDEVQTADVDLSRSFKVVSSGGDQPTGFIEDFGFVCYQNQSRTYVSCIRAKDLEELYLFTYGDEEYGGIYADPTKPVYIVQAMTDGVLAKGHFEPYPEFSEETGYDKNTMAIKLVMDEPLPESILRNAPGDYGYKIPAGTFGDRNFKRYTEGDPAVSKSDCHVNKLNYSIIFNVNDREATQKYPSSTVLAEARQLLHMTGVGYPTENSASREKLRNKTSFIQGSDEDYLGYINEFYNEENVEKPEAGKYYRVYAYAFDDETEMDKKAYLSYGSAHVAVTADPEQATGFRMVVNEDGTYQFVTGDGLYLRLLSNELSNTTDTYQSAANDITLQKLKIDGVDSRKTFGLFSMKMEGVYAYMNVKDAKILAAETSLSDFNLNKSCAFMIEEINKTSIPAPEIMVVLSPDRGSEVDYLDKVRIMFLGAGDLKLDKPENILMMTRDKDFPLLDFVIKGNSVELDFGVLPEGSYTLIVGEGAFTYTFAETPYEIGLIRAGYDVIATGITTIRIEASDEPLFDLQGRRVTGKLKSGIYIKNGKKVYIK